MMLTGSRVPAVPREVLATHRREAADGAFFGVGGDDRTAHEKCDNSSGSTDRDFFARLGTISSSPERRSRACARPWTRRREILRGSTEPVLFDQAPQQRRHRNSSQVSFLEKLQNEGAKAEPQRIYLLHIEFNAFLKTLNSCAAIGTEFRFFFLIMKFPHEQSSKIGGVHPISPAIADPSSSSRARPRRRQ